MSRKLIPLFAILILATSSAHAQEWARKMFEVRSHDFGQVARGAKSEFRFVLKNLYKEDIHLSSVRTSCGCTTPSIEKRTLKTFEEGAILAKFNTHTFLGARSATITVTIDKPFYAEVQLQIRGYIRSDVVFNPGSVKFGEVDFGTEATKRVEVNYAGRTNWKITDVRSTNPNFEVELSEKSRSTGRVAYEMSVHMKKTMPTGYLHDQLTLITDDGKKFALHVEGQVAPTVSVRPSSLLFGNLQRGEKITKKLVVHGKQPFKILDVDCGDDCFKFTTTGKSSKVHLIPVTFTAGETSGKIVKTVTIKTDMDGLVTTCVVTATVIPNQTSAE